MLLEARFKAMTIAWYSRPGIQRRFNDARERRSRRTASMVQIQNAVPTNAEINACGPAIHNQPESPI